MEEEGGVEPTAWREHLSILYCGSILSQDTSQAKKRSWLTKKKQTLQVNADIWHIWRGRLTRDLSKLSAGVAENISGVLELYGISLFTAVVCVL